MSEIETQLNGVFRDVFDNPSILIRPETTARDIEGWDSLTHIQLVVAVERKFGVRFGAGEIEKLQNVGEMIQLINSKKKTS